MSKAAPSFTVAKDAAPSPSLSRNSTYFVPRNMNGNLPVYTDNRNGETRYLVIIRNVDGNANVCSLLRFTLLIASGTRLPQQDLAKDIAKTLFDPASPEATRIQTLVKRSLHVVIQGGRWKNQVLEWLMKKGF